MEFIKPPSLLFVFRSFRLGHGPWFDAIPPKATMAKYHEKIEVSARRGVAEFKERYYVVAGRLDVVICAVTGQVLSMFLDVSCLGAWLADLTGKIGITACGDELAGYELDVDTLNMLLDSQTMSLDTKYGRKAKERSNHFNQQ